MPEIDRFKGISIRVYNGEHPPPHIHACCREHEALIGIVTGRLLGGHLPPKQLRHIREWLKENAGWAKNIYGELNPQLR
ncbi:MAG: DUF4160 domain-containing protein [Candidatus Neomarinimicrobiota bacterium]|jgi:hypothetical protein|nr:DUF4160 domain-containing protein [Candidatus Neomarinimicrobiota bacterium]MDD3966153.1 DUF4160 domain-containing protein [Candidatus Neomarinimicrobiota bacterium]MDX9781045.1 DUF4160 domain-containing protein [bacterium]